MEQEIKELIIERLFLDITPEEMDAETELVEYGVDSFLFSELIVALEEKFGVKFSREDITPDNLKSVRSLAALVAAKKQG